MDLSPKIQSCLVLELFMAAIPVLINATAEFLAVIQANPMLLVSLVALASLAVVAMALIVVHTVVSKK